MAGDSQLWKARFYNRFVRPRASRIPGIRDREQSATSLHYSSKLSKWLDDEYLVKRGSATNWKRQYKLRYNWSRGSANVSETQLGEYPPKHPMLLRLHEDIVVTADSVAGLRAWLLKGNDRLIATRPICTDEQNRTAGPTSLSIDRVQSRKDRVNIAVGYDDGSFAIYTLQRNERRFACRYVHAPSRNGKINTLAYTSPYLMTMTEAPILSLYRFGHEPDEISSNFETPSDRVGNMDSFSTGAPSRDVDDVAAGAGENDAEVDDDEMAWPPTLISSLRSQTVHPPISLAIRASATSVVASIAYAIPDLTSGWSVGLQEIRITPEGAIVDSRTASAATRLAQFSESAPRWRVSEYKRKAALLDLQLVRGVRTALSSKPTSLSYNHPYLLSAHPDNTLTLYMVTSDTEELSISTGSRLWGHTSSVSGVYVGDRGKAVSVGAIGNELRVWQLEGGMPSSTSRRRTAGGEASVRIRPEGYRTVSETKTDVASFRFAQEERFEDRVITPGWVVFDEEKVVLHRRTVGGSQSLVVYDFE